MSALVVREATFPHDSASVSALLDDYLRQTEAEKAERGLAPHASTLPERYRREVTHPAESLDGMHVLLARGEGEDCGIAVVSISPSGSSEIKRFWTTPPARGRGVGTALMREAIRVAGRPLRLSVWNWREPAIRMYQNLGFVNAEPWDDREGPLCFELG